MLGLGEEELATELGVSDELERQSSSLTAELKPTEVLD